MTEQFNLSWKEHALNTARTFHSLRQDDQLCDVTIACEEGVFLGHKIVLFASSLLFRDILRKHTHPHPLIYLKNITGRDMTSLLDFMYSGEVKLKKEQLASFSAAAKEIKVLGLISSSSHVKDLQGKCSTEQSQEVLLASRPQPINWKIPTDEILQTSMENQTSRASISLSNTQKSNNKPNIKLETLSELVLGTSEFEIQSAVESTDFEIQQLPELTDSSVITAKLHQSRQMVSITGQGLIKKSQSVVSSGHPEIKEWKDLKNFVIRGEKVSIGGKCKRRYECKICGTASVNKGHLISHIEGQHFPKVLKYTCTRCGRSQGNRESAKSHMRRSCRAPSGS